VQGGPGSSPASGRLLDDVAGVPAASTDAGRAWSPISAASGPPRPPRPRRQAADRADLPAVCGRHACTGAVPLTEQSQSSGQVSFHPGRDRWPHRAEPALHRAAGHGAPRQDRHVRRQTRPVRAARRSSNSASAHTAQASSARGARSAV